LSSAAPQLVRSQEAARAPALDAQQKRKAILCLLLAVVTIGFYAPIVHDGFVLLDDVPYILGNPPVRAGITWETIKWSFTTFHAGYWHPLTWLSHALDCQLFGLDPAGHHLVSLLFHAANAILLFLLLEEATSLLWPSLLAAALFALHPVNVESVAWAAERKNVLSMFFFLIGLWAYGRYARRGGIGRYAVVAGSFVLGLMAKPQVITFPCVLLLWDYWPLGRMFAGKSGDEGEFEGRQGKSLGFLIAEKLPLFAIAVAGSILTVMGQRSSDALRSLSDYSLTMRIENAIYSYARYLKILVWPAKLTPLYPHPEGSLSLWQVGVSALLLVLLTALTIRFRSRRYLAMGWFWFLGVLVPMIGIVQVGEQAMADRFLYIPMLGIAIAVAWALSDFAERKKISEKMILAPAAAMAIMLGALTWHQVGYWKDGIALFSHALSVTQKNYLAHQSLGMAFDKEGRVEEAIPQFDAADALHQFPPNEVLNLGIYEQRNGHLDGAVRLYNKVVLRSSDPQLRANAWSQMATASVQLKNYDRARQSYDNALQILPNDSASLMGSGLLAVHEGQTAKAVSQLGQSMKADPSDVGMLLLADALRRDHRLPEAQKAEDVARNMTKDFSVARQRASQTEKYFGIVDP
jgi:tetratricopeptide (TPR) repeat protein